MKHGHGNDSPATPASVAHRGVDVFDHRHGWEGRHDGHHHQSPDHHHHQSPASAPDPQDGLVAVIGGSAIAAGDASAVTGFVENVAMDKGAYSIAMGEAIFQASAQSASPHGAAAAADTFLDVSGADFIIEREVGGSKHGAHAASAFSELDYLAIDIHGWSPPHGPIVIELGGPSGHHQSFGHNTIQGEFAQVFAMAEAHGANTLSATLTGALTVENHFSFVNATALVAL
jgi:hypothetical protein